MDDIGPGFNPVQMARAKSLARAVAAYLPTQ
jgi:hypothetical protein